MKVAMLGLYPARPDCIAGGVEAVVDTLSAELSRDDDLEVHVITLGTAHQGGQARPLDATPTVHWLPEPRFGRLTWHLVESRRLQRALHHLQPDIVHAHGSLVYAHAATQSGFPYVVTVHGIMAREAQTVLAPRKRMARQLDAWYERFALQSVGDLIAISPYVLEAYPWLRPRQVHHIENPVDDLFFQVSRREEPLRILCPVRVIPRKGLLLGLQALLALRQDLPALQLRVAGETLAMPDYYEACQSFIAAHGLQEQVLFLDHLSAAQLAEEYARCTLMLLPSMQETAPVVIAEAMAAGVPVVATRVGGVPNMVQHGITGWLVDHRDIDGLTAALRHLLRHAPLRRAMGQQARAMAEKRFRVAAVAERTKQVYQNILSRSAGRARHAPDRAGTRQADAADH
jgi:glycosyltransferase involved in cell wall biosynthesis